MRPSPPTLSVIVPTRDRPDRLRACLDALGRQTCPRERFEVVVVDDGSAAPLDALVAPFRDRLRLRLIAQQNAGPAAARNAGARCAGGEALAFTDDDCEPAPSWLEALAARLAERPGHMVGGPIVNALRANPYSEATQLLVSYLYAHHGFQPGPSFFLCSSNLAVPAASFAALGGFSTAFPLAAGEDRDLGSRWVDSGRPVACAPEALVYHAHALSLASFWRQHAGYGRGALQFHRLRAARARRRFSLAPLAFYLRLLAFPFSQARPPRACGQALLLLLAQVATACGLVREATLGVNASTAKLRLR